MERLAVAGEIMVDLTLGGGEAVAAPPSLTGPLRSPVIILADRRP